VKNIFEKRWRREYLFPHVGCNEANVPLTPEKEAPLIFEVITFTKYAGST
jgi:hypothetical protein